MSEKKRERERVLFVVKLRVRRTLKSVRRLADRLLYSEGPRSEAVKKEREWEGPQKLRAEQRQQRSSVSM